MDEVKYKSEYRRQVAEMALAKKSTSEIAEHFNVVPGTISNILWQMKQSGELPQDIDGRSNRTERSPKKSSFTRSRKPKEKVDLSNKAIGLYERKCPSCGKTFYKTGRQWGYKIGDKELCTYSCMKAAVK